MRLGGFLPLFGVSGYRSSGVFALLLEERGGRLGWLEGELALDTTRHSVGNEGSFEL